MDIRDFGGVGDGSTDTVPAWNAAMAALAASLTDRRLHIPAGLFVFNSQPDSVTCAALIEGEGRVATTLIRGSGFIGTVVKWTGGQEMYGGAGGALKHMTIDAGQGTGGSAVWIQSQLETNPNVGSKNPHQVQLEDVCAVAGHYYPNAGSWGIGFYLDGTLNANPPAGVAAGLRACNLIFCNASQFYIWPFLLDHAHGTRHLGLDAWVPVGNGNPSINIRPTSLNCWGYSPAPVVSV